MTSGRSNSPISEVNMLYPVSMTLGRSNSPIFEVNMLYPVSSKLGLREEGHKVSKRKVHQILVKNGKTEFI